MPKKKIYMAVTRDALSLPLAVADSAAELARLRGIKQGTVLCAISRWKKGVVKCPRYIVVEVEEEPLKEREMSSKSRKAREFDKEIFQKRIRQLRYERGMTQKEFSGFIGIGKVMLYYYESGKSLPKADMLFRIAEKAGCSVDWLIGLTEEEKQKREGKKYAEGNDI